MSKLSPELLLCLHCGYFLLEYAPPGKGTGTGSYEITGYGERWMPTHRIEPFGEREYVKGTESRKLWNEVWRDAWCQYESKDEEETYAFFDYLYFGM